MLSDWILKYYLLHNNYLWKVVATHSLFWIPKAFAWVYFSSEVLKSKLQKDTLSLTALLLCLSFLYWLNTCVPFSLCSWYNCGQSILFSACGKKRAAKEKMFFTTKGFFGGLGGYGCLIITQFILYIGTIFCKPLYNELYSLTRPLKR